LKKEELEEKSKSEPLRLSFSQSRHFSAKPVFSTRVFFLHPLVFSTRAFVGVTIVHGK
jgi:hypothetical protein